MSSYLPYIILAGVVLVFFVICLIFFSGSKAEKSHKKQEREEAQQLAQKKAEEKAAWAQIEALHNERQAERATARSHTAPVPKISTVTVRERRENPEETAFVTTKGEAVRQDGHIVYKAADTQHNHKTAKDNLDATRVLSRDEIIEAMDKVDKEEAAAFKAEAEEAKKRREEEAARAAEKEAAERQAAEAERRRKQAEALRQRQEQAAAHKKEETKDAGDPSLAHMAAVVSADLAAKNAPAGEAAATAATTVIPAVKVAAAVAESAGDQTQIMPPVKARTHTLSSNAPGDETRRMEPVQVDTASKDTGANRPVQATGKTTDRRTQSRAAAEARKSPWGNELPASGTETRPVSHDSIWASDTVENSSIIRECAHHFMGQYGIATEEFQQNVNNITAAAFNRVGCKTDAEREKMVAPLIVQEALQNLQKAYVSDPQDYVATMGLRAFYDIVCCPAVSTRHLVAIDALKVMPYLNRSHYQILALLLLFLYLRNSHNVDKATFGQYIDKYVMPFLDHFPTERPYYQQLDYLHCTALETKETRFAEILADSYPLLFRYRGFTEEELRKALKGQRIPREYIVRSFNSPLIKLALVDDTMAIRYFRTTGITEREMQDRLLRLAKKRPCNFAGEEALDVMEDISPVLADLGDIWDSTLLRISTLSLLGLYLAQGYVKETIGEEFDLSRWFE